jgi:hypothetical protein
VKVASVNMNHLEEDGQGAGFDWMTGFEQAAIPLSDLVVGAAPCSLVLQFRVYNVGDSQVPSAVLLDQIRFE